MEKTLQKTIWKTKNSNLSLSDWLRPIGCREIKLLLFDDDDDDDNDGCGGCDDCDASGDRDDVNDYDNDDDGDESDESDGQVDL